MLAATVCASSLVTIGASGASATVTQTAWNNGAFHVDVPNVVRSSDIALTHPNANANQALPLGNGSLGAAVWGDGTDGLTVQLNRVDTFPGRKSLGQVKIPGLAPMLAAANFTGHLDLYDGTLYESGGGYSATIFVRKDKDELVVDVTGPTSTSQTASVGLGSGRTPTASTTSDNKIATLSETFVDNTATGASGQTFGTLAAITAGASTVTASADSTAGTASASYTPNSDGSYRIVVAGPAWNGTQSGGSATSYAQTTLGSDATATLATLQSTHLTDWHDFWNSAALMKTASDDGTGQYMQVLRTLDLYVANSSSSSSYPGSQAGVADLFSSAGDFRNWDPSAFWHWNLRMQTAANQSSGESQLNNPFFNLYLSNLKNMQTWTTVNMHIPGLLIGDGSDDCLDVTNGTHNTGNPVEIWGCSRGAANQTWAWNSTTKQYTVYQGQSYVMCLDTSGSSVVINPCSTATTQQWTPQANGQITNAAGKCLDTGGATTEGSAVSVQSCSNTADSGQIWRNPDICVPETMRFNGAGYENETWSSVADDCVNTDKSGAFYNARTLTTGAEVGLEVWNQYLDTGDTTFLSTYYPLMKYAAEFLLDYASTGADGKLHTYPSNAHETQWDVHDPTTDIAAMKALFPAVKSAAQKLNVDTGLRTELTNAIGKLRDFPLTYPSELVGARSGKCLDVTNGTHNTGNPVEIWGCSRGAANQTWAWNSTTKQYTVYQGQSYVMCLDTSGSSVVINPCSTATTQQWTPQTNGQITNAAGMCLDVTGGFMTDGTAVGVYACASPVSDNQIWSNVIAMSADVSAGTDNFQNVGLEPVWPYGLIGDDTSLTALGKTTFLSRPFSVGGGGGYDWNVDAIQAARLGLSDQFASTLKQAVVNNQVYANGFGYFGATASAPAAPDEFYGEQQGVVTTALNEALAQDYDGELRIAPSVPATWDADGTVAVQGGTRVSVQIHHGSIGPVGITAGPGVNPGTDGTYTITVRNPWPGSAVQVVDGSNTTNVVVASTTSSQINITATSGHTYVVEQVSAPIGGMTYQQVTATPASQPITLTGNIGTTGVTRTIGF